MIPAKKNKLFIFLFRIYLLRLLKRHFYRIHLAEENLKLVNNNLPTIVYANHSNWWDGFIAYFLTSMHLSNDDYFMMEIKQLKKYSMFRYIGYFSVDRFNPNEVLKTVNYSSALIKDTSRFMWIFPQGEMKVQDTRPVEFYRGIAKIAEKTEKVNLLPVAFRYEFIMEQRPEVFIKIGEPDIFQKNSCDSKDLTNHLQQKLTFELDALKEMVINEKLDDFKIILKGKESRNKNVDKYHEVKVSIKRTLKKN